MPSTPHNHPIKETDELLFNRDPGGKRQEDLESPFLSLSGEAPAQRGSADGAAGAVSEVAGGRGGAHDDQDTYNGEMGVFKGGSADAEGFWACLGDEPALGA